MALFMKIDLDHTDIAVLLFNFLLTLDTHEETFTNIDIPLTFEANDCHFSGSEQEGNDCQSDVKDLFLKQIMASETLRENNKYWYCSAALLVVKHIIASLPYK